MTQRSLITRPMKFAIGLQAHEANEREESGAIVPLLRCLAALASYGLHQHEANAFRRSGIGPLAPPPY